MTLDTITTIKLTKETKERLSKHGNYGMTMDDILNNILDAVEQLLVKSK